MTTILPDRPATTEQLRTRGGRRQLVSAGVILIAVLAAGGYGVLHGRSSPQRPVSAAPPTDAPTTSTDPLPWRRTDLKPVTQPVPAVGRFLVYAAAAGRLQILGLDARSGRTVWSHAATPSGIAPGEPPTLAVVGGTVFYLQPGSDNFAYLVGADAATGQTVWRTALGLFSGWPSVCPSDARALCVSGQLTGSQPGALLRFDASTGKALPRPVISATGGREIGPDLYDSGQRHPEVLVSTSGSHVAWRRPLAAIFTLPGASTDYGWTFQRVSRDGMFVGSPGAPPVRRTSTEVTINLAHSMTGGFKINDGTVAWRDSGSFYLCDFLQCPGSSPTAGATDRGPSLGVRLRARGLITGRLDAAGGMSLSPDARGVLEGFDPTTGHTTWRFDAGRNVGLLSQTGMPPRAGRTQVLLSNAAGHPVLLDLATGRTTKPDSHTDSWCRDKTDYRLTTPYRTAQDNFHNYIGQDVIYRCDARGHRSANPTHPSTKLARALAAEAGQLAWSSSNGVLAVPAV